MSFLLRAHMSAGCMFGVLPDALLYHGQRLPVMLIDFDTSDWKEIPHMNGGEGIVFAKMVMTESTRIILTKIPPGSSIGKHLQSSGDDVNYVLDGKGKAICDGKEEILSPSVCHVCPKGSEHSIVNDGDTDLILFTTVPMSCSP